ncbi:MAG TPA: hypothetical protein GXX77_03475 [Candidatus Cloacimonetes bacterium]|nr:hypothetical protein [Candidatus Cloacimonadota bacterium]
MSRKHLLYWKSWPFAERPLPSALLIIFLIFLNFLLYWIAVLNWEMPFYFFAGNLLVILNLAPYFIVTEYWLLETEVKVRYIFITIRRPYSDFGCFYMDKRGVMLSTFVRPRRLDPFRGLSLRFSKTQEEKAEMVEILKEKIGKEF